ncbi:MAG: MFS transporter [Cenarchaeum sp. SB0663_bin_5]|nr:MFS transporter [Cenarchaeum sp. SB0663_bin_5]MYH04433.1 MFS transporter [Cenarchaeum sp. SB0675_bin_21]MYL11821.1 MFS transporter [Cenarchaeum sp. SB0669_bin_11]
MNRFVVLVFVTALVLGVSYGMHGPVVPVFAKDSVGATYAELGLIGMANFLPYMIIPIFVGILLDRINNRYLLTVGVILNAISLYLTSTANTVEEIIAYRLIAGVAHAFFWPTSESILSGDEESRVKYISWFIMFFVVGFMVGPLLGSVVLDMVGSDYRMLFQITAFVMAVAMTTSVIASPKTSKPVHGGLNLKSFGAIARFPVVVTLLLYSTAAFGVILTIYPAFMSDRGMGDNSILLLFFIFGITRVGALLVAGFLSKRAVPTFAASTILVSVGMGITAIGTSFIDFTIALLLLGFGCSILYPLALEVILSGTKKSASGRMIGAYEAIFGVGWAAGPAINGYATDAFGEASPYWLFCILGMMVTVMVVVFRRRLERVSSERVQD